MMMMMMMMMIMVPMSHTLVGIVMDVREEHPSKAKTP